MAVSTVMPSASCIRSSVTDVVDVRGTDPEVSAHSRSVGRLAVVPDASTLVPVALVTPDVRESESFDELHATAMSAKHNASTTRLRTPCMRTPVGGTLVGSHFYQGAIVRSPSVETPPKAFRPLVKCAFDHHPAGMAELVDAPDSKSGVRKDVRVRVRSRYRSRMPRRACRYVHVSGFMFQGSAIRVQL